jgi:Undecaprenyl-phosphate galactose phosphotransferase WbaP
MYPGFNQPKTNRSSDFAKHPLGVSRFLPENERLKSLLRYVSKAWQISSIQWLKRSGDMLGSALGLLFLAPFFGLTALLITLDSPGGIFYRQARLGKDGKVFELIKFRTMRLNGNRIFEAGLHRNPKLRDEWDHYQKLKSDPRITRVGRFLRQFSLDEFPQLWNVLRGEMSLVGPRPITPDQRELYGDSYQKYIQFLPGMTGLWQVSGRNTTTFARRVELDREYIRTWSIWLDIYILFKTIKTVLGQQGAY